MFFMKRSWLLGIFCALMGALAIGAVLLRGAGWLPASYYAAQEASTVLDFSQEEAQPVEQSANSAPEGAVDILVSGKAVLQVESREAAIAALNALLEHYQQDIPLEEQVQSIAFLHPVAVEAAATAGETAPLTAQQALERLLDCSGNLCPVQRITWIIEESDLPYETQAKGEDPRLPKGARLIQVAGRVGVNRKVTQIISVNGREQSRQTVEDGVAVAATALQYVAGSYTSSRMDREPGRSEGEKGPELELVLQRPVQGGHISSNFGMRKGSMHYGVDYHCDAGTQVLAPASGEVVYAGPRGSYGNVVEIDHGQGMITRLARLNQLQVALGDVVEQGQLLGVVAQPEEDDEQPRLHMEALIGGIPYNPRQYLD